MKVGYFLVDNGACSYYRLALPIETMAKYNGVETSHFMRGDNGSSILGIVQSDIMVVPRVGSKEFLALIPQLRDRDRKIVVDQDDNMFEVSPFSPHYEDSGRDPVMINVKGEKIALWVDKKDAHKFKNQKPPPNTFDMEKNRAWAHTFTEIMRNVDMVTVTQPILAEVYGKFNKNVKVLPNCIDPTLWQKLPLKRDKDEIRLYWSGGASHYEDLLILKDVLPVIFDKYPKTRFITMGQNFNTGIFSKLPQDRMEHHEWVATPAYPYKTAILDCDISLIPLQDNDFNRCKSNIKWVEQSALGIPSVTSYVSPYKEYATEDNGLFVAGNAPEDWIKAISMLVEEPLLRAKIGGEAQRTVLEHFDINKKWTLWHDAYKELL